jgi:aquaporin Z
VSLLATWRAHRGEYAIEAWGLGMFMISACAFSTLLFHPASPVAPFVPEGAAGRAPMGLAMALTAIALVYSPWGRRSGAHFNPAFTLAQYRLGKMAGSDLAGYVAAQFFGAAAGVFASRTALGALVEHPSVNHAATVPGAAGPLPAFAAEATIAFILMSTVLSSAARPRLERYTGLFAAGLVALYITVEAPVSGMSLNPARSFGSALFAGSWADYWVYVLAPTCGMLLAAEVRLRALGRTAFGCAKMRHVSHERCIFCRFVRDAAPTAAPAPR